MENFGTKSKKYSKYPLTLYDISQGMLDDAKNRLKEYKRYRLSDVLIVIKYL